MTESPRIYALFGAAANDSLYPAALNAAFAAKGIKWPYVPFRADGETLAALFERLKADGLAGANFIPPCEEAASALCTDLSPEAAALAAVDAVRCTGDAVEGFNLTVYSFARALEEKAPAVADKPVVVLGGGPAARAYGLVMEEAGAAVTYAVRDVTKPRPGVSSRATVIRIEDAAAFVAGKKAAVLVDATPLSSEPPPLDDAALPDGCFVFDSACGRSTPLLEAAKRRGLPHADGLTLFLYKTARAFELWTGTEAPVDVMRRAAEADLAKRDS
jgi:shikimate dehydrogenase